MLPDGDFDMVKEIMLDFDFKLISKDNEKIKGQHGKYYLSQKYKNFELQVKLIARSQMVKLKLKQFDAGQKIRMEIFASFKSKVHADMWNLPKSLSDALQGVVYENDRQIKYGDISILEGEAVDNFSVYVGEL